MNKFVKEYPGSTEIVYYVGHQDNSFFETTDLEELFDDPYILDFLGIEVCKSITTQPDHQTGREWVIRIVFNKNEIKFFKR